MPTKPKHVQPSLSISSLHDFALDIDHHENDEAFAADGGEIIYFFDENIFQLFVYPFENDWFVERDRDLVLGKQGQGVAAQRKAQNQQTALLTSELLFGGKLPGQRSAKIHLTEWHRWELLDRANAVLAHFSRSHLRAYKEAAHTILREKFNYWLAKSDSEDTQKGDLIDPRTAEDIEQLGLRESLDFEALSSFVRNRETALILATDQDVEPAQQLSRILSPDMQKRFRGISHVKRPVHDDLKKIERRAHEWSRALRSEYEAHQKRGLGRDHKRSSGGLWSDARSLALLEWLNAQLNPLQRKAVLITGDTLVFDCYRRLISSQQSGAGFKTREFMLRRPLQYTPTFLSDTESPIVEEKSRLFETVREAVELRLLPVRIASLSAPENTHHFIDRRFAITLPPVEEPLSAKSELEEFWQNNQSKTAKERIAVTDDTLRLAERVLIGLSRDLIERRLSDDEKALFESAAAWSSKQEALFGKHIEKSIEQLIQNAIGVWLPVAERFYKRTIRSRAFVDKRRIPISLNLTAKVDGVHLDLQSALEFMSESSDDKSTLEALANASLDTPFDVFKSSAALALFSNRFKMAQHFSGIAIDSSAVLRRNSDINQLDLVEAYYLLAMSKRFLLGEIVASPDMEHYAHAERLYNEAADSLDECEKLIKNPQAHDLFHKDDGGFSLLRCRSERAALHLFFVSLSIAFAEQMPDDSSFRASIICKAIEAHKDARITFEQCISNRPLAGQSSYLSGKVTVGPLAKILLQLFINSTAWFGLGQRLASNGAETQNLQIQKFCVRTIQNIEGRAKKLESIVFDLEIAIFRRMFNMSNEDEHKEVDAALARRQLNFDLIIDRYIYEQMLYAWNTIAIEKK